MNLFQKMLDFVFRCGSPSEKQTAPCTLVANTKLLHQPTYLHHFFELLQIASDQIQESELVEVFSSLVSHFNHLVIALQQCCFTKTLPTIFII